MIFGHYESRQKCNVLRKVAITLLEERNLIEIN